MSDRDELLGQALCELPVPDHRAGFVATGARLPVIPALGATALILIAVGATLALSIRPQRASAADVLRQVARALETPHSVSGTVVGTSDNGYRYTVVVARDGSYRTEGKALATAYDAQLRMAESISSRPQQRRVFQLWTHVDPGAFVFALRQNEYALALHALTDVRHVRVSSVTFEGRDAWKLDLRLVPNAGGFIGNGHRVVLIVDRQTGFVLSAARYLAFADKPTSTVTLENLHVDVPTPRSLFRLVEPPGVRVARADLAFSKATPSGARAIVGYRPLLPSDTRGLPLIALGAARDSVAPATLAPGSERRNVVSAVYGNGFATAIAYSTRSYDRSEGMPPTADLNGPLSFTFASPQPVKLTGGAFAGEQAWISASQLQSTFLWVAKGDLVVRIESTLSKSAVIAIANSIEPG